LSGRATRPSVAGMYAPDHAALATPIGLVRVHARDRLESVTIVPDGEEVAAATALLRAALEQLSDYFAGHRTAFDLPLAPSATPRGEALRAAMAAIPFGETRTYGEAAHRIGSSPRALGGACRRNPFPVIIPCHRVISASGAQFYSAGAGPSTKAWLLAHERQHRS